jgi:hypothetical protein
VTVCWFDPLKVHWTVSPTSIVVVLLPDVASTYASSTTDTACVAARAPLAAHQATPATDNATTPETTIARYIMLSSSVQPSSPGDTRAATRYGLKASPGCMPEAIGARERA